MLTPKELSLNMLKGAEQNFLLSLKDLRPEDITKQVDPEINAIAWIVGHCISHMDAYNSTFTNKRLITEEEREFFAYGAQKQSLEDGLPFSFSSIVDRFFVISKEYFKNLEEMSEEELNQVPTEQRESYLIRQQRLALHLMGHAGQITVIRRMLGNPSSEIQLGERKGWSFVSSLQEQSREKLDVLWHKWWNEVKSSFD